MTWIFITLFAVVMQSVRTAGQKALTQHLDAIAVTLVRFLFGLPFALVYLLVLSGGDSANLPHVHAGFWMWVLIAGVTQIIATVLLVHLFSLRNFAVGTTYARTEAFLTALIGSLFFAELISQWGWVGIILSVVGVMVLTVARNDLPGQGLVAMLWSRAAGIGLASGAFFAVASLGLRQASLSLNHDDYLISAAVTLVCTISLQTALMLPWIIWRQRPAFLTMMQNFRVCVFVGLTSALGSAGWFTAVTLERASYVKALGQVEFLLSLVISTLYFKETTNRIELLAMAFIAAGVTILVLLG